MLNFNDDMNQANDALQASQRVDMHDPTLDYSFDVLSLHDVAQGHLALEDAMMALHSGADAHTNY